MRELTQPFFQLFQAGAGQWHPWLVHFPLVFLEVEALFLIAFLFLKKPYLEKFAFNLLKSAFFSYFIVALAGFHDVGLELEGNQVLKGMTRWYHNRMHFDNAVSIHVWLAIGTFAILAARFLWRSKKKSLPDGVGRYVYVCGMLFGMWSLLAMSYVGGRMSHD